MCKASRVDDPVVHVAAAILDRQRRHNTTRLDWIVDTRAGERHWPEDLAREYLGGRLRYQVGEREREAVDRFLHEAAKLGVVRPTSARWADEAASQAR
jgi:hypothetical protein